MQYFSFLRLTEIKLILEPLVECEVRVHASEEQRAAGVGHRVGAGTSGNKRVRLSLIVIFSNKKIATINGVNYFVPQKAFNALKFNKT